MRAAASTQPLGIAETPMSDLIEIFKLVKETVGSVVGRKHVVAEKAWDDVVLALDKLGSLSNLHIKAVAEVTEPLLTDGNVKETAQRYNQLVNNPDFPQGYDEIRGILAAARRLPSFKEAGIQDHIQNVLDELTKFQYGVFTLSWDSYHVADAVAEAARVATREEEPTHEIVARAAAPFITTFTGLFQEGSEPSVKESPTTREDLMALVQRWAQSWQRHVQRTLYGSKGLNSAIAQLKMQRHA